MSENFTPKPEWLKIKVVNQGQQAQVEKLIKDMSLNTVCEEAACPNRMECFNHRTATFMILGKQCTRNCTFCNVGKGIPEIVDDREPVRVAEAVRQLGLRHAVITSVTRDDLEDGGAYIFAEVIIKIREACPDTTIEVLIPDFKGSMEALRKVIAAFPDVLNHNMETVPSLYHKVRPMADYRRSLKLLSDAKEIVNQIKKETDKSLFTKSGIMLGLGETTDEVISVFSDLLSSGCDFLTIGQYLSPSKKHHPVIEYIHPDAFEKYREIALGMGFIHVASSPFVRSSYNAAKALKR